MASGKENRDDPFEDDDARLEADREDGRRPARSQTFYQPLAREAYEDSRYQPEEVSFFSRSPDERAEQARRASQRVRRRASEEDVAKTEPPANLADPIEPTMPQAEVAPNASTTAEIQPTSSTNTYVEAPASQKGSILDRAVEAPAVATTITDASSSAKESSDSGRGSLLDRATELTGVASRKITASAPQEPSLMDRMVVHPVPEKKKPKDAGPSLMDRAMEKTASEAEEPYERFKPESVLSAPPKPTSRGSSKQPRTSSAKTKLRTAVVAGSSNPSAALAKKAAYAPPLAERMKELAQTKSARQAIAESAAVEKNTVEKLADKKPAQKKPTKPRVRRAATPEEAVFAAPPLKPEERKLDPVVPPAPSPAAPALAAADTAPRVDASESLYAEGPLVASTLGLRSAKTKPFAAFEWMIASRYLRARKKEGFVSVIAGFSLVGIALGVATLIVVMAVMTGFRETLITQIIGGSPHINVYSQSDKFENYDALADEVRTVDGVLNVTPVVQGQVLGTGNQRHSGVIVRGMRKADLERLIANAQPEKLHGDLNDFVEDKGVALGADLAAKLGLRVGDFITLISPDGDITPFQATPLPRVKDYRIIQTFKLGVQEIDFGVAFMPFDEAQIYFNKKNQADTLDVFVEDPQNVSPSLRNIQPGSYEDNIFQSARSSISVNNWMNLNGRLIGAINLERQVMFVILTMIILVAALNIISGLVMLVKDKARDVAIMRTMGMARGSILRIFFVCGSSIGVIGSILGVILGVTFALNIHAVQRFVEWATGTVVWDPGVRAGIAEIPSKVQFSDVALTLFIALSLSFIATLFPAWKAAKLDPVEALRYE